MNTYEEGLMDFIDEFGLNKECYGCGRDLKTIVLEDGYSFDDETLDEMQHIGCRTVAGDWYCSRDCFRDRGIV